MKIQSRKMWLVRYVNGELWTLCMLNTSTWQWAILAKLHLIIIHSLCFCDCWHILWCPSVLLAMTALKRVEVTLKTLQGSVLKTMWNSHVRVFMGIGLIKLFDNVLTFAQPLLLEQLLLSLQEGKSAGSTFLMQLESFNPPTFLNRLDTLEASQKVYCNCQQRCCMPSSEFCLQIFTLISNTSTQCKDDSVC